MFTVLFTAWSYEVDFISDDLDKAIIVEETGYTERKITMKALVPDSCAKTQKEANKIFTDLGYKLRK